MLRKASVLPFLLLFLFFYVDDPSVSFCITSKEVQEEPLHACTRPGRPQLVRVAFLLDEKKQKKNSGDAEPVSVVNDVRATYQAFPSVGVVTTDPKWPPEQRNRWHGSRVGGHRKWSTVDQMTGRGWTCVPACGGRPSLR